MKYKGYVGHVTYDDEAKMFQGEIVGINDVITFQGESVQGLEQSFQDSIDDYLDFCKVRGELPEKPYSGRFNLRLSPEMHAKVAIEAKKQRASINSFIVGLIEEAV